MAPIAAEAGAGGIQMESPTAAAIEMPMCLRTVPERSRSRRTTSIATPSVHRVRHSDVVVAAAVELLAVAGDEGLRSVRADGYPDRDVLLVEPAIVGADPQGGAVTRGVGHCH